MSMIQLGPYTTGEIPAPLQVTFKDSTGTVLNLSGYAVKWIYRPRGGLVTTQTGVLVSGGAGGIVQYTWVGADFATAGDFEAEMWVGNGSNRFCSQRYAYHIHQAIAVPAI